MKFATEPCPGSQLLAVPLDSGQKWFFKTMQVVWWISKAGWSWALSCIWKYRAMAVMWKGLTESTYFSYLSQGGKCLL